MGFENLAEAVSSALDIEEYDISPGEILDNGIQQIILTDTKKHSTCIECTEDALIKNVSPREKYWMCWTSNRSSI